MGNARLNTHLTPLLPPRTHLSVAADDSRVTVCPLSVIGASYRCHITCWCRTPTDTIFGLWNLLWKKVFYCVLHYPVFLPNVYKLFLPHANREALLAEMGVAIREDGGTLGVFSPKKVYWVYALPTLHGLGTHLSIHFPILHVAFFFSKASLCFIIFFSIPFPLSPFTLTA